MRLVTDSPDRMAHLVAISRQMHAIGGAEQQGSIFAPRLTQGPAASQTLGSGLLQSFGFARTTPQLAAAPTFDQENAGCALPAFALGKRLLPVALEHRSRVPHARLA